MRQLHGLLVVIRKAELIEYYKTYSIHGAIHKVQVPSLSEFLGASGLESPQNKSNFDDKSDKAMEAHMMKRISEGRIDGF